MGILLLWLIAIVVSHEKKTRLDVTVDSERIYQSSDIIFEEILRDFCLSAIIKNIGAVTLTNLENITPVQMAGIHLNLDKNRTYDLLKGDLSVECNKQ